MRKNITRNRLMQILASTIMILTVNLYTSPTVLAGNLTIEESFPYDGQIHEAVIISDIWGDTPNDHGNAVATYAISRLGHPYSQGLRGQGKYIDCSGLAQWCYKQIDINLPDTAAEQGQYCVQNNAIVSRDALVLGDLVFYSDKVNGRYMNITHVGIYVGDGMIIDASYKRGQVVYRKMWGKPVMYGRPHIIHNTCVGQDMSTC